MMPFERFTPDGSVLPCRAMVGVSLPETELFRLIAAIAVPSVHVTAGNAVHDGATPFIVITKSASAVPVSFVARNVKVVSSVGIRRCTAQNAVR